MNLREWWTRVSARLSDRLIVVPLLFAGAALVLSQITLAIDRDLGDDALPRVLETTVDSADSILSTIAGGLISAITLLLSLVLVSVQLASSQFSPRTVRDWIGDKTQQRTIGVVLGTTVFCLMVLRETQTVNDSFALAPHVSVLIAVALAIVSLIAVVRSVDHLSNSMRIESVARSLVEETLDALREVNEGSLPMASTAIPSTTTTDGQPWPHSATVVTATSAGWVQRVGVEALVEQIPEGAHATLMVGPGAFVYKDQPLAWVDDDRALPDDIESRVFTIGDSRLIDHDVAYGLLQMSDIALRALSPGVNDPNTAVDVVVHMGIVLLEVWELPEPSRRLLIDGTTIDLVVASHDEYLDTAFSQILRYGQNDFELVMTMQRTLRTIIAEVKRRDLPGPTAPLEAMLDNVQRAAERSDLSSSDKTRLERVVSA